MTPGQRRAASFLDARPRNLASKDLRPDPTATELWRRLIRYASASARFLAAAFASEAETGSGERAFGRYLTV
jgi:hypothetical protein